MAENLLLERENDGEGVVGGRERADGLAETEPIPQTCTHIHMHTLTHNSSFTSRILTYFPAKEIDTNTLRRTAYAHVCVCVYVVSMQRFHEIQSQKD